MNPNPDTSPKKWRLPVQTWKIHIGQYHPSNSTQSPWNCQTEWNPALPMGSIWNSSTDPETGPTTAGPGPSTPRLRSSKNEERARILRHTGEKARHFSAYRWKTGRFTFLKVVLLVGQLFWQVYNLPKFIDKWKRQIVRYGQTRQFLNKYG